MRFSVLLFGVWVAAFLLAAPSFATDYPTYGSLKRDEVNVRTGPGTRYPILWVFQRYGWPIAVLNRFENWYKIRDVEGEEGWVYAGMVSFAKTAVINGDEPALVYKRADGTKPFLKVEPQNVVSVYDCTDYFCNIEIRDEDGWVVKTRLSLPELGG